MASVGRQPKLIFLLVVLCTILHSVNSRCGWSRSRYGDDYDDDEDRYEGIDADHDDDDKDDGERRGHSQGRSFSGNYDDRDDPDHDNSDEYDENDEYVGYGRRYGEKKRSRKYSDASDEDRKYHIDKSIKPTQRCHMNNGYCMRKKDRCKGEIRFFQTNCIDECECCMGSKEQVSGHNIEIVRRRRDWQGARDECRDKGGDLFVPKSVGDLLYQLRKNQMSTHKLWIGISDTKRPGQFRGIQGNRIREGWQNREPRAHEVGDDCVVVQHRSDAKRGMRTRRCREEHFFICDLSNEYRSDHTVRY